eukprot:12903157-Prorocentrum_lima.AAC.1
MTTPSHVCPATTPGLNVPTAQYLRVLVAIFFKLVSLFGSGLTLCDISAWHEIVSERHPGELPGLLALG